MIEMFSHEENHNQSNDVAYKIKILKENDTADDAEDTGSVMRDALAEFWDTFYLQYTEENTNQEQVQIYDHCNISISMFSSV